ncbi:MAG: hypothetical protein HY277_07075, partial [Ignavibacteriales bacterium]|nr:hypothetical protein [Ignavibacteriales bacterium]
MKYFFIIYLLLPVAVLAQQRYLVTPTNEAITLRDDEGAINVARKYLT